MAKMAFMTIGLLHSANWDTRVQGFFDRIEPNFSAAEARDGFLARSIRDKLSGERRAPHFTDLSASMGLNPGQAKELQHTAADAGVGAWSEYDPISEESIMPVADWAYAVGSELFSRRLEQDYLKNATSYWGDFFGRLAELGREGSFWY